MFESRPLGEGRSELGEHAIAGRELDESLAALWESLMIARQPTPPGDPGKAALDDPSSGQRTEARWKELVPVDLGAFGHQQSALGHGERLHRLHGPAQLLAQPSDERAPVMTIAPDQLEPGKRVFQRHEQGFRALLIGSIGCQHFDGQQMALGVNEGMSFAPPDFFSPYRSPFQGHEPHWF